MSAFLTRDSISAQTPERQVLFSDLTLSIGAERLGLVGRNGSGKSTLIRIVAGMAESAAGVVRRSGAIGILAQDWPEEVKLAQGPGMVFRDVAPFARFNRPRATRIVASTLRVEAPAAPIPRTSAIKSARRKADLRFQPASPAIAIDTSKSILLYAPLSSWSAARRKTSGPTSISRTWRLSWDPITELLRANVAE